MDPPVSSRHSDFSQSFKLAIRSLLTSCPKEEFVKAFSNFSSKEQENLHYLFIQVITSLHKMIEDEFESLCHETQVRTTLDTVDQLVEEQSLNPLFSKKTNIMDVARELSIAKENEIRFLTDTLEKAEKQNRLLRDRIELLKKGRQNVSGAIDVEKLRSGVLNCWKSSNGILDTPPVE
ncbi:hypothetical protein JCGZ_23978 [Jatropha curcas]|uniref:Uncharacterized protein n=1 Tax=Jatropha curcas TaxID=180498 RepID=A0A067JYA6_JATCU|nr:uncharacterized protein LOC105646270 isoform X2 [Jatropha curcas]KDP24995.1 hypothetical protein JCGZ_23978 [Jatropha curcas]